MGNKKALEALSALEEAVGDHKTSQELHSLVASLIRAVAPVGTPLCNGGEAIFLFFGPAYSVEVTGTFSLEEGDTTTPLRRIGGLDVWIARERIPANAEFLYRFSVDGQYRTDPICKETIEAVDPHSVARMPKCERFKGADFRRDIPHGVIETFEFLSTHAKALRRISVYLPPSYRKSRRRYPVLYFHEHDPAIRTGHYDRILDNLIADGRIEPVILCMIEPANRALDYWFKDTEYANFVMHELVPTIDYLYRTRAAAEHRATVGPSLAGRLSVLLALGHPEVFGIGIGNSAYVDEDPVFTDLIHKSPKIGARFYLDVGLFERAVGRNLSQAFCRDLLSTNRAIRDMLLEKGAEIVYHEWPGCHAMLTWQRGMEKALEAFWPAKR